MTAASPGPPHWNAPLSPQSWRRPLRISRLRTAQRAVDMLARGGAIQESASPCNRRINHQGAVSTTTIAHPAVPPIPTSRPVIKPNQGKSSQIKVSKRTPPIPALILPLLLSPPIPPASLKEIKVNQASHLSPVQPSHSSHPSLYETTPFHLSPPRPLLLSVAR